MAQRRLICPACSQPVEVPDHYLRANIACPFCNIVMDRRSGELVMSPGQSAPPAQAAPAGHIQPQPQQFAQQQGPSYPYPAQYAPPQGYNEQRRGFPRWAIVLIVVAVAGIGGFIALTVWATGKVEEAREIYEARESGEAPPHDKWVTYDDQYFTAKFPRKPEFNNRTSSNGIVSSEVMYRSGPNSWEIAYFDLPMGGQFNFEDGMRGVADAAEGRITLSEDALHQGFPGRYGEIDNGRLKMKLFRVKRRVYVLLCGKDYEYFVDNFRLTDFGMGVQPLSVTANTSQTLYVGVPLVDAFEPFYVRGGRTPYKFDFGHSLPQGLEQLVYEPTDVRSGTVQGTPVREGKYEITATVTDADGRDATAKTSVVVKLIQKESVYCYLRLTSVPFNTKLTQGTRPDEPWVLSCEVGLPLEIDARVYSPESRITAQVGQISISVEEGGEWLAAVENRPERVGGAPLVTGNVDFTLEVNSFIGTNEYIHSVPLRIEVMPIAEKYRPATTLNGNQKVPLSHAVGIPIANYIKGVPVRPSNWSWSREWHVEAEWEFDESELPPGMTFELKPLYKDSPDSLWLSGTPDQSGVWKLNINCNAKVKFIEEPYDMKLVLTLDVTPVPEKETPTELTDPQKTLEVGASVGKRFGVLVPFSVTRPNRWNHRREWKVEGSWLTDEVELPPGVKFETKSIDPNQPSRLYLSGTPEQAGEWEIEVTVVVSVKYIDKTFEIPRKIKLTVTE